MVTPLTPDDPMALGSYRLAGRLGEGGQGVVYLGFDATGERVAVKVLSTGDQATRTRLARELDALESIASFCTARVLDAATQGPRPYVVSEFVDGPSLADRVRERGPLRGGELERLAVGTATALAAIHAAGVVHRDFKPANVLLGPDGARVVDFGIARAEGAATLTSGLIGTPTYLSPEQINGSPATATSDVFAWGATVVFAATGSNPFGAETVPAVLQRVLHFAPDLSPLPSRLRGIIAAALSKNPARRPTARDLMVSLVNPDSSARSRLAHQGVDGQATGGQATGGQATGGQATGGQTSGGQTAAGQAAAGQAAMTGPAGSGPRGSDSGFSGPGSSGPAYLGPGGTPPGGTGTEPRGVSVTGTPRRSRSRGLVIGVAAVVAALAVGGGTILWLNRSPTSTASTQSPPSTHPPTTDPSTTNPPTTASSTAAPSTAEPSTESSTGPSTEPTQVKGGDKKIPAAFAGTWKGTTKSVNPLDVKGAENTVTLKTGQNSAAWAEKDLDHTDADCSGTIALTQVEASKLTFSLEESEGDCIPGTIVLTLQGDKLNYSWLDAPGLDHQTGDLQRS